MADHIIDESLLVRLQKARITDGEVILAIDRADVSENFVNIDDATKVFIKDNRVLDIGKNIRNGNALDTGVFLCSPGIFGALETSVKDGDTSLSGGIRVLAHQGKARVFDIGYMFWVDVDDEKQLRRAEKTLYRMLVKPSDGVISRYVNRRFSVGIFTPLFLKLHKGVTPNQVSVLSFCVASLSSLFFILGHALTGAVLIELSSILDGCDGEIARLRYLESSFGDFLDAVLDRYADGLVLLGILYYLLTEMENREVLGIHLTPLIICLISVSAIVGHVMVSYTSAKSVVDFGHRYQGRWIAAGRGRDVRLFQLFIGGLMTWFHPIFALLAVLAIAVQTNAIVLRRILLTRKWFSNGREHINQKIRAIIFDFDGTVADTMPFLTETAVKLMTENYDVSREVAKKRYLENTGMDFASQIELIFPGHPKNREVVEQFESIKEKGILTHSIFPEAIPVFKHLRDRKIKIFLCSSTRQEIVDQHVKLHRIDRFLDGFLGYKAGLGKGEQIDLFINKYQLDPGEVLFVGDSLKDLDYVRPSVITFVGISRIFRKEDFQQIGAPSVSSLSDLVRLLDESQGFNDAFEEVS
jgi:CDP-L-myo-inositol myo-inositolphosphotransferase